MEAKCLKIETMKIYKFIYYYFYLKSSKKNAVPEIPVYTMLSFTQTSNLITITNVIMIITLLRKVSRLCGFLKVVESRQI